MKNILFGFLITIALIVITIFFLIFFYLGCSYKKPTRKGGPYYFKYFSCKNFLKYYDEISMEQLKQYKYPYYEVFYNDKGLPILAREYINNKINWEDRYYYSNAGNLIKRVISNDNEIKIQYFDKKGYIIEIQYFDKNSKLIKIQHFGSGLSNSIDTQYFNENNRLMEKK